MNDRERIFRAIMHWPAYEPLLFELSRDCPESCVIDQAIGLYERDPKPWGVAFGLREAMRQYPRDKWTCDELAVVAMLIVKPAWWTGLIDEFAEMWKAEHPDEYAQSDQYNEHAAAGRF